MKALTSKEVWYRIDKEPKPFDQTIEEAVNLARIGMIPESEAVRIPPVSEWPDSASGVLVGYYEDSKAVEDGKSTMFPFGFFRVIHRPAPAWTPNLHDRVFFDNGSSPAVVCLVTKAGGPMFGIIGPGIEKIVGIKWLKPFDASKIGKPWEEM